MCQEVVHVHSLDRLTSAVLSEPPRGTPASAQVRAWPVVPVRALQRSRKARGCALPS